MKSNQADVSSYLAPAAAVESIGKLPLSFEANRGQADPGVKFLSHGNGYLLLLAPTEIAFVTKEVNRAPAPGKSGISSSEGSGAERPDCTIVRIHLIDTNPGMVIEGLNELPGRSHYFLGSDPDGWQTGIPSYSSVRYGRVYPGVDLVFYGNGGRLEYDFLIAPGADLARVRFRIEGADRVEVSKGNLIISAAGGELQSRRPLVFQAEGGVRKQIEATYQVRDDGEIRFLVGDYDQTRPLVIDPALVYSSFLGGNSTDLGWSVKVDVSGNAYVTGCTTSTNFPLADSIQSRYAGAGSNRILCGDVFVAKINAAGLALVYSTYLGGPNDDGGTGIAVDSTGNAFVTGFAGEGFPTTAGALQVKHGGGGYDSFVAKLDATGSKLIYSTYLGGSGLENVRSKGSIAVDASGHVYVAGSTDSPDFPTRAAIQVNPGASGCGPAGSLSCTDAFVAKLNGAGSSLIYSTYLGGTLFDVASGIAVDPFENAYVTGTTVSSDFPLFRPYQPVYGGGSENSPASGDVFVTKITASGSALVYSTYLGGIGPDGGHDIAVDSSGNAYITGSTSSRNFPLRNPVQADFGGGLEDVFVSKLNPDGSDLGYSTYLGGSQWESGSGIAVDATGSAFIAGQTASVNYPIRHSLKLPVDGVVDMFVTRLSQVGSSLVYSTLIAEGTASDIAVDVSGNAYIIGSGGGIDFPLVRPFQPQSGGSSDALVLKISPELLETETHSIFFPQIAVAGGFSTVMTLVNVGSEVAIGNLILTNGGGTPLPVTFTGLSSLPSTRSSVAFSLSSGAARSFMMTELLGDDRTRSGWARIDWIGGSIAGMTTIRLKEGDQLKSAAGVLASEPVEFATIPVDNDDSENRFAGFAVSNPSDEGVSIRLVTLDQDGNVIDVVSPPELSPLGPRRQIARFLHEPGYLPARLKFKGSLALVSEDGKRFAVVALVLNQGLVNAIPVISSKAPQVPN